MLPSRRRDILPESERRWAKIERGEKTVCLQIDEKLRDGFLSEVIARRVFSGEYTLCRKPPTYLG